MSDTVLSTLLRKTYRATLTRPSNTDAYTAGEVISAVTTNDHYTFGSTTTDDSSGRVSRPEAGTVTLNSVTLWSSANVATKLVAELWLFQADIAEVADSAAFAPTDAEMLTLVAVVAIPAANWFVGKADSGADGNAVCVVSGLSVPIKTSGTGLLYGQLVARNAYAPVSAEVLTCDIVVTQD